MSLALGAVNDKQEAGFSFTSRPNCSLTARGRLVVFWVVAGVTLTIASVFAAMGYWLTLPFAGLEIGVLAWAFEALKKHSGDYESLTIDRDEVRVERKQGERLESLEFNRQWVSLVQDIDHASGRIRLALRSHGRETELGVFLTEEARQELGNRLLSWIRPGR